MVMRSSAVGIPRVRACFWIFRSSLKRSWREIETLRSGSKILWMIIIPQTAAPAAGAIEIVSTSVRDTEAVDLCAAKRVVSIGRGLAAKEDLALIEGLASALEAEVGCTRPIAEGQAWLARERYIGVSGVMLSPDLFVAVGLSGQIQHMVGAAGAKTIIAINKDKSAPVFKQCDYGIIGDLYDVVPQLTAALKA